jgi:NADPH-dependent curcumin reductase CurA
LIYLASGAFDQLVGQIGKIFNLHVVGSAGSDEKVEYLKSIGFHSAFNYKTRDTKEAFAKPFPNGIVTYSEKVGGKMLENVISHANNFARLVYCGMISHYNTTDPFGLRNLLKVIPKALSLLVFAVGKSPETQEPFRKDVSKWLQDNLIKREIVADDIEKTHQALVDALHGNRFGKQVVKVA